MFAAPMPTISWLPSISWPVRSAKADAVEIVSASETSAMPAAPATSSGRSESRDAGDGEGWKPLRQRAHELDAVVGEVEKRSRQGWKGRRRRGRPEPSAAPAGTATINTSPNRPTASAAGTVSPLKTPLRNPFSSGMKPSASTEKPNSFGSWPTRMVRANPFMYPIIVGFESRSATKPSLAMPAERHERAHDQREHRSERDRALRIAVGAEQRQNRRSDHRPERRVRPQHQDFRRPEHGVPDQTEDRGVEAGDRRKPGQLRIGHSLRHEQSRQNQSGDDVLREPTRPIGREHP